jgi:hypothetical protein
VRTRGEPAAQHPGAALAPLHRLPVPRPEVARQDVDARRPGAGLAPAAPAQFGRHPGPDRRGEQVAGHGRGVVETDLAYAAPHRPVAAVGGVHQHDPAGQAGGDRPAQLVERDLGLGREAHRRGHAGVCDQFSGR